MSLLSLFGFKEEPEIEEANKKCADLLKIANDQVKVRKDKQKQVDEEAKAEAKAVAEAKAAPVEQTAPLAGQIKVGGRRRKTSRKSPSKKRATKSMYSKIKKWFK